MKNPTIRKITEPEARGTYLLINERWEMYDDGAIYDTAKGEDIPQWIFVFRDFVLENLK